MQIVPGLYSLGDTSGGRVRAFLIDSGGELTLIDTLVDTTGALVLAELAAIGKKPSDLTRVILTHAHQSHMGGLAAIKAATGARVYCHEWEAPVIEGKRKVEVPKTTTLVPQRPFKIYPMQVGFVLRLRMPKQPTAIDQTLKEGDHVGPLTVMGAPGHTPGSLTFWWPEKKALIAGDIVSTWPEVALGWPQITLDNKLNRDSVGKLAEHLQADILCVGHGQTVTSGAAQMMKDLVAGKAAKPELLNDGFA
jgi:glyoxylase-like metal-dependent hydrolase (beta-lactamase superfamily II)